MSAPSSLYVERKRYVEPSQSISHPATGPPQPPALYLPTNVGYMCRTKDAFQNSLRLGRELSIVAVWSREWRSTTGQERERCVWQAATRLSTKGTAVSGK